MMKKKKGGGGGANWMDTYGDMVTLLVCFLRHAVFHVQSG